MNEQLPNKMFKVALVLVLCLIGTVQLHAQKWEIGIHSGFSNYFGDLNTEFSFALPGMGHGFLIRNNISPFIVSKTSMSYGTIFHNDNISEIQWQQDRGMAFQSSIMEISQQIEFNFFEYIKENYQNRFTTYVLLGAGIFYYNPYTTYNSQLYFLQPLGTEGQNSPSVITPPNYALVGISFPIGGGVKWALSRHWALGLEAGYRFTSTDYLDDVSTVYPDPDLIYRYNVLDPDVAVELSGSKPDPTNPTYTRKNRQRGDSVNHDAFMFTGLQITYTFKDPYCPSVF